MCRHNQAEYNNKNEIFTVACFVFLLIFSQTAADGCMSIEICIGFEDLNLLPT
jgi:hypothetical protein